MRPRYSVPTHQLLGQFCSRFLITDHILCFLSFFSKFRVLCCIAQHGHFNPPMIHYLSSSLIFLFIYFLFSVVPQFSASFSHSCQMNLTYLLKQCNSPLRRAFLCCSDISVYKLTSFLLQKQEPAG